MIVTQPCLEWAVDYVRYHSGSPEGQKAQLQAIAIITAGLDSDELLQQELTAAIGPSLTRLNGYC
jgi:hypothetical protein